jgi:hypothetical protein
MAGFVFSSSHLTRTAVSPLSVEDFLDSVARTPTPMRFEKLRQRRLQGNGISIRARMDRVYCAKSNALGNIEALKERQDFTTQLLAQSAISIPKSSPEPCGYSITTKNANRESCFAKPHSAQSINNRTRTNQGDGTKRYLEQSAGCPSAKNSPTQQRTQQARNGEMTDNRTSMNLNKM